MDRYHIQDFLSYYGQSFLIHPRTGEVIQILGASPTHANRVVISGHEEVELSELDWKHVATPPLGYRSVMNGKGLYYITRKAGRRAPKGVTPQAIVINIPGIIRSLGEETGTTNEIKKHAILGNKMAKSIFNPEFVTLEAAVKMLTDNKYSLGFALDGSWAVTLGLYACDPYLLHFKNIRVATSKDGKDWEFFNKESENLFNNFKEAA